MNLALRIPLILLFLFGSFSKGIAQQQGNDSLNITRLSITTGLQAGIYVGGMLYLSEVWYADHQRVPLHWYNDNAGWNQMDKWGHAYIAYYQSKLGYQMQRWSGVSKKTAIWTGGTLGFIYQLPIEIFDGIYEGYGFSWGDVGANTFGTLLFMAQEWWLDDQPVKMKFSFYPSDYAAYRPRILGETPLQMLPRDYNAHTYWLSTNLNKIIPYPKIPDWIGIAVGYSAGGMLAEFENPRFLLGQNVSHVQRYRQFFLSPDIDLSKFSAKKGGVLKTVLETFNILKFPAPAIEYNTQSGWIFHFIYF